MRRRGRAGMTLVEVVIGLVIMALLGAVLIPQVTQRLRDGQAAAIANNISSIRIAVTEFRKSVGRYPSELAHLSTQPSVGAADLCGRVVPTDWATIWRGPYLAQVVGPSGIAVDDAIILNQIRRNPETLPGGSLAELLIDVTNVDQAVASVIERNLDSSFDLTAGTIRWLATGSDQGTLTLAMPVRGC